MCGKKIRKANFFSPTRRYFSYFTPFFAFFPPLQGLVPGYAQDYAIHNKVLSIGRQTINEPITNTAKTSSFRNAMALLFKWNPFDRTVVKNYLFSSGLQKDTGIFVVKFLSPLGVKGYKAHGHEEIHLPINIWSTREFHSTLTLLLRYPLKVSS